jgi:hypothetical protein
MGLCRLGLLFLWSAQAVFAGDKIQSYFEGPVDLEVWRHWQSAWNVERIEIQKPSFELIRGFEEAKNGSARGPAFCQLLYRGVKASGLEVRFWGFAFVRGGKYDNHLEAIPEIRATSQETKEGSVFRFAAPGFLDDPGERIVQSIHFEVLSRGKSLFNYGVLPMYVRGSQNYLWKNPIDSFLAHGGHGQIEVANASSGESGFDKWNGQLFNPTLGFVDYNNLKAGAEIGMHRHLQNQELWLVQSGSVVVSHGMAKRAGHDYSALKKVDSAGAQATTDAFPAGGGWLETRELGPGEFAAILPDPKDGQNFCYHGLLAFSDAQVFTMGTKN